MPCLCCSEQWLRSLSLIRVCLNSIHALNTFYLKLTVVLCLQVMLLGDSGVGKTCLLVRFKDNAFLSGNFISTVGIDFRVSFNLNL